MAEVTGMKWEEYLQKEVLDPLGMTSSTFWPTDKQLENQIGLYQYLEGKPAMYVSENGNQQRPYNDSHVFASAGAGLWTTARQAFFDSDIDSKVADEYTGRMK